MVVTGFGTGVAWLGAEGVVAGCGGVGPDTAAC